MKKIFAYSFIILVSILLIFTGCTNESPAMSKGSLKISIKDSIAKGISPSISMNASYFVINGEYGSFESVNDVRIEPGETKTFESLASGTWTFSAVAYNSNGDLIGKSNPTSIQVLPSKTTEASLTVYEQAGNGTFTVNLNVNDWLNSYTLQIYKLVDGVVTEVGEEIAFEESEDILSASVALTNGFYAFTIDCSNTMIKLPPLETFRIIADDSVTATYDIEDTGDLSISMDNAIVNNPLVTISIVDGIATASVSNMGNDSLIYTWYADRTKLEASDNTINVDNLSDYETITCVVQNSTSDIIWSCTENL